MQELATVLQHRLPAVVVVDNDGYTVERAIHGPAEPYNDITHWGWTHAPPSSAPTTGAWQRPGHAQRASCA